MWEREIGKRLWNDLKPGETAIDVGAHIGVHAMVMANAVGVHGLVLAFEPQKDLAAAMRKTLTSQSESPFDVHEMLLSNDVGQQDFYSNGTGRSRILPGDPKWKGWSQQRLQTTTLDRVVQQVHPLPRIGLIKIDVEGHEFEVLEGAALIIEQHRPIVYIEIWQERSEVLVREDKWRTNHANLKRLECWADERSYDIERLTANDFVLRPLQRREDDPLLVRLWKLSALGCIILMTAKYAFAGN